MSNTRIYMIRHGKAAAGWDGHADPGLDATGHAQAEAVMEKLLTRFDAPVPVLSSPLRRCQETAAPLLAKWNMLAQIEPRVAEIIAPVEDLAARTDWLRRVMAGSWATLFADTTGSAPDYRQWYGDVLAALHGLKGAPHVIVYSHFIALNVAYSAATGHADMVGFRPDNCSMTIFETDGANLSLVEKGQEAETRVN